MRPSFLFALRKVCAAGTSSRAAERQREKAAGGPQRCRVDGEYWEEWGAFKTSSKCHSIIVKGLKFHG